MFVYIRSAAFIIVVTQKPVLQQSKNVTAKCAETLSPPPSIQYLLDKDVFLIQRNLRNNLTVCYLRKNGPATVFLNWALSCFSGPLLLKIFQQTLNHPAQVHHWREKVHCYGYNYQTKLKVL